MMMMMKSSRSISSVFVYVFIAFVIVLCTTATTATAAPLQKPATTIPINNPIQQNGDAAIDAIYIPSPHHTNSKNGDGQLDGFDLEQAYIQLMFAYAAYCPPSDLQHWSCYWCSYNKTAPQDFVLSSFIEYNGTNTFGYIGYSPSAQLVWVVFRGTQMTSLENWITNLNFPKTSPFPDVPNAEVHEGFYETYMNTQSQVHSGTTAALQACGSGCGLQITGHSLGAALSLLCLVDLMRAGYPTPSLYYNFGSPRVGNQAFADYVQSFNIPMWRLTNQKDIVPHLPIEDMGFYHIATEVWFYDANLDYKVCDGGEDTSCSDSVFAPLSVEDHLRYLNLYLEAC